MFKAIPFFLLAFLFIFSPLKAQSVLDTAIVKAGVQALDDPWEGSRVIYVFKRDTSVAIYENSPSFYGFDFKGTIGYLRTKEISIKSRPVNSFFVGGMITVGDFMFGGTGGKLTDNGIGFFVSFGLSTPPKENQVYENISYNQAKNIFEDAETGKTLQFIDITAGITFHIMGPIYGQAGIGFQEKITYKEFYDPFEILGEHGKYFTDPESETGGCFNGGIIWKIGSHSLLQTSYTAGLASGLNLGYSFLF